ncbi:MAG: hypothetical protein IPO14_01135 [Saprospiraceae bacterium]|nr:hypothetical protein [Saprospiraceae bacterium]
MIKLVFVLVATFYISNTDKIPVVDLEYIRTNYDEAVSNETLCKSMIEELSKNTSNTTYLGYLGAFQTIWAKYTSNPISKLSTFSKGKKNIEKAIKSEPENVELRFIRLSIQKNCPSFLGYNSHIDADKLFIKNNLNKVSSAALKQMCLKII